jgi:bacteriocin biosynthesis cyclodehydratase domain-containing protein
MDEATEFPRFRARFEPIILQGEGLFILQDGRPAWLRDPIYVVLAPILDGAHSIEEIFAALSGSYPSDRVYNALTHLRKRGYLADGVPVPSRPESAVWEHFGVSPLLARSRLECVGVSVVALGGLDAGDLTALLRRQGAKVVPQGDFTVVVTDDYLRPELEAQNIRALASGRAWLLAKPVGVETWNGPLFVPGETGCWECLAQRLRGHGRLEAYLRSRIGADAPRLPPASIHSTRQAALAEAATEISRWIGTDGQSLLLGRVASTNIVTQERRHHALMRRPQCAACGAQRPDPGRFAEPVCLQHRPKIHRSDGGNRAQKSAQVLTNLERHVSPITGVVSRVESGERTRGSPEGETSPTPIIVADHNFSDMYEDRFFLKEGWRLRSGGKGKTVEQARISALAESVERYCGVFDGTEPRIRATFATLEGAIHPNVCMGYSDKQYAERDWHNRKGHKAHWVPEPFREDAEIEWAPLWSLTADATRFLPTSFCYYGYRSADPLFARGDSNGCAAGAVLEEAVLQGFLELVERDAVALWWYNRLRRRGVELKSVGGSYVPSLINHYRSLRREIWALDITSDFGIPTFAALSRRIDKPEEDIIYGFGAHLDAKVALIRAMTELNQSLEAVPSASGAESNRTYRGTPDAIQWWRMTTVAREPYLSPDLEAEPRPLQDFRDLASDDLLQDVMTCRDLAAAHGVEILVLDQSRPDIGFPVARVVAPGLRHFWARFGPGRLYDVPLWQGWLPRSLAEEELNPFVIQF